MLKSLFPVSCHQKEGLGYEKAEEGAGLAFGHLATDVTDDQESSGQYSRARRTSDARQYLFQKHSIYESNGGK